MFAVHIGTSLTVKSSAYGKIKGENVKWIWNKHFLNDIY